MQVTWWPVGRCVLRTCAHTSQTRIHHRLQDGLLSYIISNSNSKSIKHLNPRLEMGQLLSDTPDGKISDIDLRRGFSEPTYEPRQQAQASKGVTSSRNASAQEMTRAPPRKGSCRTGERRYEPHAPKMSEKLLHLNSKNPQ